MANALGASLTALATTARSRFGIPGEEVAAIGEGVARLDSVHPLLFALYFDLLDAARRGDEQALAKLWPRLAAQNPAAPTFHAGAWGALGAEDEASLLRAFNADPTTPVQPVRPSPEAYSAASAALDLAVQRLQQAAPELLDEIRELVRWIIFATADGQAGVSFDGATSLHCAGALLLNVEHGRSWVAMVDGLAHESGHALLFAAANGEPLVVNGLGDRYASPLRAEPRPLEGVYHAAFVSARRAYALDRLLAWDRLDGSEFQEACLGREAAAESFASAMATIDAHAQLTPLGRKMIEDARGYMALMRPADHQDAALS